MRTCTMDRIVSKQRLSAAALEKAGIEFIGLMEEGLSVHFRAHRVPAIEESEGAPCGAPS